MTMNGGADAPLPIFSAMFGSVETADFAGCNVHRATDPSRCNDTGGHVQQ